MSYAPVQRSSTPSIANSTANASPRSSARDALRTMSYAQGAAALSPRTGGATPASYTTPVPNGCPGATPDLLTTLAGRARIVGFAALADAIMGVVPTGEVGLDTIAEIAVEQAIETAIPEVGSRTSAAFVAMLTVMIGDLTPYADGENFGGLTNANGDVCPNPYRDLMNHLREVRDNLSAQSGG